MDRDSLIKYILENSSDCTRRELEKLTTDMLIIIKVQVEIELSKKTLKSKRGYNK